MQNSLNPPCLAQLCLPGSFFKLRHCYASCGYRPTLQNGMMNLGQHSLLASSKKLDVSRGHPRQTSRKKMLRCCTSNLIEIDMNRKHSTSQITFKINFTLQRNYILNENSNNYKESSFALCELEFSCFEKPEFDLKNILSAFKPSKICIEKLKSIFDVFRQKREQLKFTLTNKSILNFCLRFHLSKSK